MPAKVTILDGPMGTELAARGVPTPLPGWSAHAIDAGPAVIRAVHGDYAAAGATVHTANTFRTKRRTFPHDWERLARAAVGLARGSVPATHRVAGSLAPLEDCYRPDLSPALRDRAGTREEHAELAGVLAAAGCDLLLCEAFPEVGEALLALDAAAGTGLPVWVSFTAGPTARLLTPREVESGARLAAAAGAAAVLVNCVPAPSVLEFVRALGEGAGARGVPFGAYANAGEAEERSGWRSPAPDADAAHRYADEAARWVESGATIVGSCCGTGPGHTRALAERFGARPSRA